MTTQSFKNTDIVILLLKKAAPFMLTRLIEVGADFAAMAMLANLGEDELAASALIGVLQPFLRGVAASGLYAVGGLASGAKGQATLEFTADTIAAKQAEVGQLYRAGLKLALYLTPWPVLMSVFISPILQACGQSTISSDITQTYLRRYAIAFLPSFLFAVNQQIAQATDAVISVVAFTALNRLITLGLAALWMHQKNGGVEVVAYSYSVGAVISFLAFSTYFKCHSQFRPYRLCSFSAGRSQNAHIQKLWSVGVPIMGYAIAELGSVVFLILLLGALGNRFAKAAQPSLQYTSLLANLIFAFGQGASILVSEAYGAKENEKAEKMGDVSIWLGFILPNIFLILAFAMPNRLSSAFIKDETLLLSSQWFLVAGFIAQIFDALRNTGAGTNRGLAKYNGAVMSQAPMLQNIVSIVFINIPLSLALAYGTDLQAKGAFVGRAVAIFVSSLCILDTWLKTKKHPGIKLSLLKAFCPRVVKAGRLDTEVDAHAPLVASEVQLTVGK